MKNNHDPKLRQVLNTWQVSPPPAPEFQRNVWRRIAAADERAARTLAVRLRDWFLVELPKPGYAAALLVLTGVLGAIIGDIRADHARDDYRVASARQYLASIDPLTMAASGSRMSSDMSR
jgi:hypothetical protein